VRIFGVALALISAGVVSAGCGDATANTARQESIHWPRGEKTGGWIVTLDRNERVQSIRVGDLPPQLRK